MSLFVKFIIIALPVALLLAMFLPPRHPRCVFDRNEPGPVGDYGQWWWEYYKCDDGTERRVLVAGPRG